MKRVLAAILAIMMVLSMAGCGAKNNEPVYDGPELVRNPQIDLGENLPFFVLTGEYMKDEITEAMTSEGVVESYTALSPKVESLCIYKIPANGGTIMDRMNAESELYSLDEQQLYFQELDTLIEPNDYHYGYYMAYREAEDGTPFYAKNYIFLDGSDYVKIEFKVPAYEVSFDELNVKLNIPYGMSETEIPEELDLLGNSVCCFMGEEEDNYPDIAAYAWAAEGKDIKAALKWYEDTFEVKVQYFYNVTLADGNKQDCVYLVYYNEVDGVKYEYETILTVVSDTYVQFTFRTEFVEDVITVQQMSVAPIMWSIDKKN